MKDKALSMAYRYLSFKDRTEQELVKYLEKKEFTEVVIIEVIDKLKEYNYLNDQRYMQNFHRYQTQTKGYGPLRVQYNLQQKGISKDKYQEFEGQSESDYYTIALKIGLKKLKDKRDLDSLRKLYAFLLRRGYSPAVVSKVINTLKDKENFHEDSLYN
ncbi:regulatory protein RecX [Alkalicella caledoniensis]|uniref:Regulatory protein RecX n=1 Tax=Alkalicella caledoniensis TaxID=2731377 RepID=A0A7G9WCT6_ALKCA|nr:regulatory protein RecX [Alkalicella caledoniensis]QNO16498.1 regulatory protein RecX [Alkalicella caledoniensis]